MTLPLATDYPPMEAKLVAALPEGPEWQYEPKWDGFRCLAFKDGDDVDVSGGFVLVHGLEYHVAFELFADVRLKLQRRHLQEADGLLQLRGHGELLTQLQLQ